MNWFELLKNYLKETGKTLKELWDEYLNHINDPEEKLEIYDKKPHQWEELTLLYQK